MVKYMGHYDNDKYPETPLDDLIPWQEFVRDFWSVDLPFDDETCIICDENMKRMVDLRPYMQTGPHMVFTTDHL